MAKIQGFNVKK
jgi:hypothetical protein